MSNTIDNIVGQQAFDDIAKLEQELVSLDTMIRGFSQKGKEIELTITSKNDIKGLSDAYKELVNQANAYNSAIVDRETKLAKLNKLQLDNEAKAQVLADKKNKAESDNLNIKSKSVTEVLRLEKEEEKAIQRTIDANKKKQEQEDKAHQKRLADAKKNIDAINKEAEARELAEAKAQAREDKAITSQKTTSLYDNARKELNALTNELRSYDIALDNARKSGKYTDEQLKSMANNIEPVRKRWNELNNQLSGVENNSGGSFRSRNALLVETNQLLREMPNFAISARTGILSLSNNLPMFFEAFARAKNEIDTTTGKTKGFGSALKALGGAIMSPYTIMILLVTLLTQYADKLDDIFDFTSEAEKATKKFSDALKETNSSISKEVAILQQLSSAFNGTSTSIEAQREVLRQAQGAFAGYFDSLQVGNKLTNEQNALIEKNIALLKEKAKQLAIEKVIQDDVNEALLKERELLSNQYSTWEKITQVTGDFFASFVPGMEMTSSKIRDIDDGTTKLSKTNEELYLAEKRRLAQGETTIAQFEIFVERLLATEKAQNRVTESINIFNNVMRQATTNLGSAGRTISDLDLKMLELRNSQKSFLNTSKEWKDYENKIKGVSKEMKVLALNKEYFDKGIGTDALSLFQNKEYIERYADIMKDDVNEARTATKSAQREIIWDWRKAVAETNKEIAKITRDTQNEQDEASMNYLSTLIDNEKTGLDERLAYQKEYQRLSTDIVKRNYDAEIKVIEEEEARVQSIQVKLGKETADKIKSIDDLKILERNKAITSEQKEELAKMFTFNARRIQLQNEYQRDISEIEKKGIADKAKIADSNLAYESNLISNAIQTESDNIKRETNNQILLLRQSLGDGLVGYSEFNKKVANLMRNEQRQIFNTQISSLGKMRQNLIDSLHDGYDNMSEEARNLSVALLDLLNKLEGDLARGQNTKSSKFGKLGESIGDWLGLGSDDLEELDKTINMALETLSSFLDTATQLWANFYEKKKQQMEADNELVLSKYEDEEYRIKSSLLNEEEKQKELEKLDRDRLANERRMDRERKRLEIEQAKREREMALFSIAINTAIAIAKAWADSPLPLAIAQSVIIAAQGAMQAAIVMSKPLPAYEHGTPKEGHKGGLAIVGEKRRELVVFPDGSLGYTPSTATVMDLPKGTHVIPNPDNMSQMAKIDAINSLTNSNFDNQQNSVNLDALIYSLEELKREVKNLPINVFDFKNGDLRKYVKKGNLIETFIKGL